MFGIERFNYASITAKLSFLLFGCYDKSMIIDSFLRDLAALFATASHPTPVVADGGLQNIWTPAGFCVNTSQPPPSGNNCELHS